ncbi:hypothetical protein ACOMHN_045897 [Nucella lapillus]
MVKLAHTLASASVMMMMPGGTPTPTPTPTPTNGAGSTTANHVSNGANGHASSDRSGEDVTAENDYLPQLEIDLPIPLRLLNRRRCSQSFIDAKEHAYARLMAELSKAQRELELKDEECDKLSKLRGQMMEELDDLTASLFEEANKSIQDAHLLRIKAEKRLEDATQQTEVLQGEVTALKFLVMTSTPASPNGPLSPKLADGSSSPFFKKNSKPFWKKHRRSTSQQDLSKDAPAEGQQTWNVSGLNLREVDSVGFEEFRQWKEAPCVTDSTSPFLTRVFSEDIQPCLNFANKDLAERVLQCVQQNTLSIEPISGDSSLPRNCCLSNTPKLCNYKIRLEEDEEWYSISQMCRNRIASVCNFYTYIRYICQNLVKSADKEIFQEIANLRLRMTTARLGC